MAILYLTRDGAGPWALYASAPTDQQNREVLIFNTRNDHGVAEIVDHYRVATTRKSLLEKK